MINYLEQDIVDILKADTTITDIIKEIYVGQLPPKSVTGDFILVSFSNTNVGHQEYIHTVGEIFIDIYKKGNTFTDIYVIINRAAELLNNIDNVKTDYFANLTFSGHRPLYPGDERKGYKAKRLVLEVHELYKL